MRALAWLAAGFAAADFLAVYLFSARTAVIASAAALLLLLPCVFRLRGRARRASCLLAAGLCLGFGLFAARRYISVQPAQELAGEFASVCAEVREFPEERSGGYRVPAVLRGGESDGVRVMLYLYEESADLQPGDRLNISASFFDSGKYNLNLYARGIYLSASVVSYTIEESAGLRLRYFPQYAARAVKNSCDRIFPADVAPLVKALLTGDKTDLKEDTDVYSDMDASGMLHIVAVSGMHVLFLVQLLRFFLGNSRRSVLIILPVLFFFVLLTGAPASVVRAVLMQALLLLAPVFRRESDSLTSFLFALLVLLLINPYAAAGYGLQLSFASVAGILFVAPRLYKSLGELFSTYTRAGRFLAESLSTSFGALVFSLPLIVLYFGKIPLLSWLANLLTLSVLSYCFAIGWGLSLLGIVFSRLALPLAWVTAWPLRLCLYIYHWVAEVPFGCLYTDFSPAAYWLIFVYAVFLLWAFVGKKRGLRVLTPFALSLAMLGVLLLYQSRPVKAGTARLAVLDVGQGQSVALLTPEASVLVDCGSDYEGSAGTVAANYFQSLGLNSIDALIITHAHADHINGICQFLSRVNAGCLLIPEAEADDDLQEILSAAAEKNIPVYTVSADTQLRLSDVTFSLAVTYSDSDENENGIVIRAETGGAAVLIPGDAGKSAERQLLSTELAEPVDALVVGHHGSDTASSSLFLQSATPAVAVISVGEDNIYGLPNENALERLSLYCGELRRTDEEGHIILTLGEAYG